MRRDFSRFQRTLCRFKPSIVRYPKATDMRESPRRAPSSSVTRRPPSHRSGSITISYPKATDAPESRSEAGSGSSIIVRYPRATDAPGLQLHHHRLPGGHQRTGARVEA